MGLPEIFGFSALLTGGGGLRGLLEEASRPPSLDFLGSVDEVEASYGGKSGDFRGSNCGVVGRLGILNCLREFDVSLIGPDKLAIAEGPKAKSECFGGDRGGSTVTAGGDRGGDIGPIEIGLWH
jgi:hypothetical protein